MSSLIRLYYVNAAWGNVKGFFKFSMKKSRSKPVEGKDEKNIREIAISPKGAVTAYTKLDKDNKVPNTAVYAPPSEKEMGLLRQQSRKLYPQDSDKADDWYINQFWKKTKLVGYKFTQLDSCDSST